jgi:uroporphyrinogen decarboxylase
MTTALTSAQRIQIALSHHEPDRVPFLIPAILQGARELGLSIPEYFSNAEAVAEGQIRLRQKFGHDGLFGFLYSSQEFEAFGGETLFRTDGPPNAGTPVLKLPADIDRLEPPDIDDSPTLLRILRIIELLRANAGEEVPVLGVAISPFSLPVMQMGFEAYLVLMHEDPVRFERLVRVNEEFTVAWANAQIAAGATAISYADAVSSPTIVSRELYLRTGYRIACRTIARIHGPCATGFASGRILPILDDVARTGTVAVAASAMEDLALTKSLCRGRLGVMGNLNAIEMRNWTPKIAELKVKEAIAKAGPGGGFVLTDNHGEIPWQVPDEVLDAISHAVHRWGTYPLDWVASDAG